MPTLTPQVDPKNVLDTLGRHMLVDGYHVVMDLERSRGSYIYDSLHEVEVLDLFSHFATIPIAYNHPKLKDPAFLEELHRAALTKPANSDIYTQEMARFVATFARVAVPESHARHLFFVEGGSVGVENTLKTAFDWKVRKNFRKGYRREVGHQVIHFEQAFHGRTGYTLSLTNTADPRKTMYFPKFPWPRIVNPKLRFPVDAAEVERVAKVEALALAQVKQALAGTVGRSVRYSTTLWQDLLYTAVPIQSEGKIIGVRMSLTEEGNEDPWTLPPSGRTNRQASNLRCGYPQKEPGR